MVVKPRFATGVLLLSVVVSAI